MENLPLAGMIRVNDNPCAYLVGSLVMLSGRDDIAISDHRPIDIEADNSDLRALSASPAIEAPINLICSDEQSMKTLPALAGALLLAAFHSGCINIPTKVPEEWDKAMSRPARSIAGTYQTTGDMIMKQESRSSGRALSLSDVFNGVKADQSFCPPGNAIRLQPVGKDQLEITVLQDAEVVATRMIAADIGAKTSLDGVEIERQNNRKNSKISNLKTHNDAVLMKGTDGCLYVRAKYRARATLVGVIPFGAGGEAWLRFPPVP